MGAGFGLSPCFFVQHPKSTFLNEVPEVVLSRDFLFAEISHSM